VAWITTVNGEAAHRRGADVESSKRSTPKIPGERLTTPDIAVVDGRVADTAPVRCASSAVLLVVEIVSPGSRATDRAIKPDLYAEAGIPGVLRLEFQPAPTPDHLHPRRRPLHGHNHAPSRPAR